MENLIIFDNEQFGEIRTLREGKTILFCGSDVAKALGYARPNDAISAHCKGAVKRRTLTNGGMQELSFIPEKDIYRLAFGSKLASAEKFTDWVTEEVLPSIRETGGYIVGQESMSDSELMAKALLVAQKQIEERQKRIDSLTQKVELDAPKVLFADAVAASHTSILIGEFAKLLKQNGVDIGRDRLFAWLRENGWLIKDKRRSEFNSPTQKGMNLGLFDVKEGTVINPDGSVRITRTTKVTGKGQEFFINLFLRGGFANG